jgi:hypothetical protein
MKDVPLSAAVRNLARQMDLNYILDPRVENFLSVHERTGSSVSISEPNISLRWENMTAYQALVTLLKEHGLTVVTNPVTSVARITPTNHVSDHLPAPQLDIDTNGIIPLIRMDSVPVIEAITNLATRAHLEISVDPEVLTRFDPWARNSSLPRESRWVEFRWENLTAKQALTALLDNYDLGITKNQTNSTWRIGLKEK